MNQERDMRDIEKIKRILNWIKGDPCPPYGLEYNITSKCNLDCKTCKAMGNFDSIAGKEEISEELTSKLVQEASELGVRMFDITGGGEPLMSDLMPRVMEEIKEGGLEGYLTTNGTLLTENVIGTMVENNWDYINISLDGPDASTHDALRGRPGTFGKVIENIKNLQERKKKTGNELPIITINTVWSSKNNEKLPEVIDLCEQLGLHGFNLQPMRIKYKEYAKELKVNEKHKYVKQAFELTRNYGIESNLPSFIKDSANKNSKEILEDNLNSVLDRVSCFSPFIDMKVMPDGKIGLVQGAKGFLT